MSIHHLPVSSTRSLVERIRDSAPVKPVFIIGPPRSGTTLIACLLAHSDEVLSLSEPFGAWRIMPRWMSRPYFTYLSNRFRGHALPPLSSCPARFYGFIHELARRHGREVLVIKEVFHDFGLPAPWWNVDLLDQIADSGAAVIAVMRNPFDTIASTLNLVQKYFCGWYGLAMRLTCPSTPRFADDDDIIRHAASNWSSYADWIRRRSPFVLRYEDLTGNPGEHVHRVCAHAGIRFDPRMLSANGRPISFAGIGDPNVLWRRPKPVHHQSVGRGDMLQASQRVIIQKICRNAGEHFGYKLS